MKIPKGISVLLILLLTHVPLGLSCHPAEYPIGNECCPKCPAGSRVKTDCTEYRSTSCLDCEPGTYLDQPSGLKQCLRCRICSNASGLKEKISCTKESNTVCEPQPGFFCVDPPEEGNCETAQKQKLCKPGEFIKSPGTGSSDTVCSSCAEGTFSNGSVFTCQSHTQCKEDQVVNKPGTLQSDVECGDGNRNLIIGTILGVVFALLVVVFTVVIFYIWKRKKNGVI